MLSCFLASDVQAWLRPKSAAWAQPGGAHSLGDGQAEHKLSRKARSRLFGEGFQHQEDHMLLGLLEPAFLVVLDA